MKKYLVIACAAIVSLCMASCGAAVTTSNNVTETKVVLQENNFRIVGQARGEVSAKYICGFGGTRKKALMANAIDEMSRNANLQGAQTLTNITTHISVKMITPLYIVYTCSATANIVEFK